MDLKHSFYLMQTSGGRIRFNYYTQLNSILAAATSAVIASGAVTFLSRTKEEGFELASLFLVHGVTNPVEIFDAEDGTIDASRFLQDPTNHVLALTWEPKDTEFTRRAGKTEIRLKLL